MFKTHQLLNYFFIIGYIPQNTNPKLEAEEEKMRINSISFVILKYENWVSDKSETIYRS